MNQSGVLYVVATPIGNLGDMAPRALEVLSEVAVIAAEDTRHSARLLNHFGVSTPCIACHDHNERQLAGKLVQRILQGENVALISDAGTPLISDPGYHLVREARQQGVVVIPIPGASAMIAALSASGLPSDRFIFEGFLPAKDGARRSRLEALANEPRTLIYYESPHRIEASIAAMAGVFGGDREAVIGRELTKKFETIKSAPLAELQDWLAADSNQRRGEFVVLIHGAAERTGEDSIETDQMLTILLAELPVKQAAAIAAKLSGEKKNKLYKRALELSSDDQ